MTENNHIYLNDLPTNPTLKETNYSNHLLKEISPYLNKQFSNNFSENNIPRITDLNNHMIYYVFLNHRGLLPVFQQIKSIL